MAESTPESASRGGNVMAAGGRHFVRGTKLGHGPAGSVYGFDGKDRSGVGDEKWPNSWLLRGNQGVSGSPNGLGLRWHQRGRSV